MAPKNKKPKGVKHPNATLSKAQVAKIWALKDKNPDLGCRRITEALGLPVEKRGAIEKVLLGLTYRDLQPESKRPRGVCVNDRGDEIRVWDREKPVTVVSIRDGVARCTGYDVDYPVPNAAAMSLADFAAILKGFEFIKPEQQVLDALKAGTAKAKRQAKKS